MRGLFSHILFLFFSGVLCSQTNAYLPFPDSNAIWITEITNGNGDKSEMIYMVVGDTLIDNTIYHKLYDGSGGFSGAYRNDTVEKKIYCRGSITGVGVYDEEFVLYDFSYTIDNIGDTIILPPAPPSIPFPGPGSLFACSDTIAIITNIDSILIGNQYRKRITAFPGSTVLYFIEGIGSSGGLFSSEGFCGEFYTCMTGFIYNDQNLYTSENCTPYSTEPLTKMPIFIVYPNPGTGTVNIKNLLINSSYNIELLGVYGNRVFQFVINHQKEISIDLSSFQKGIYYLHINEKNGTTSINKIIIR